MCASVCECACFVVRMMDSCVSGGVFLYDISSHRGAGEKIILTGTLQCLIFELSVLRNGTSLLF